MNDLVNTINSTNIMNGFETFQNDEFGSIRVCIDENGDPWFVGKDVAKALGYEKPNNALAMHVDPEDKKMGPQNRAPSITDSLGRTQYPTWINESGLYSLVLGSKLPGAKRFKHWVTGEVIPSVRKHGTYMTPEVIEKTLLNPDFIIGLATELKKEQEKNRELNLSCKIKDQQIEELQPKATYYDLVLQTKDAISITSIAKDYGKSARWLNAFLHEKGVQYKQGRIWLLYQKYAEKGYTQTKTDTFAGKEGEIHSCVRTCWTQKGRLFIYDLLKEEGILPLIERESVSEEL